MFYDIPNKDGVWMYNSPMSSLQWQTWIKPQEYSNFYIYVAGGGGGGGAGVGAVSQTHAGAGGGSAALSVVYAPSYLLPETLYIQVGAGGIGGTSNTVSGTAGSTSYLCYYPSTDASNVIIYANGGGGGTTGAGSISTVPGGSGGTVFPLTTPSIFSISSTAGAVGASAPGSTFASNVTLNTTCLIAGGAASVYNSGAAIGGGINGSDLFPSTPGGAAAIGSTVNGVSGSAGYLIRRPFTSVGGAGGGGGQLTRLAGNGGSAVYGAGGGGGGSATNIGNVGLGGNGGNGFVIIIGY